MEEEQKQPFEIIQFFELAYTLGLHIILWAKTKRYNSDSSLV